MFRRKLGWLLGAGVIALAVSTASAARADEFTVSVEMAEGDDAEATDAFPGDVAQVIGFFESVGSAKGDKVRGVFIATDTGGKAPADTKVAEDTITCPEDDCVGKFSLSKPTKGFPAGHYRLEIEWNGELVSTTEFTIGLDE